MRPGLECRPVDFLRQRDTRFVRADEHLFAGLNGQAVLCESFCPFSQSGVGHKRGLSCHSLGTP